MKKSDGDRARLLHILEAIQYIQSFTTQKGKSDIYLKVAIRRIAFHPYKDLVPIVLF
jgi:uncharacterized protein with HEPN domain